MGGEKSPLKEGKVNLEVGGGMKVLAGLPGAPALDEVHADGDAVVVWVD